MCVPGPVKAPGDGENGEGVRGEEWGVSVRGRIGDGGREESWREKKWGSASESVWGMPIK